MSRLFVAVGGTGQHTALALADYLVLAHSVVDEPLPPVEFILLDSDSTASGKGTKSAWDLCSEQLTFMKHHPDRVAGSPEPVVEPPLPPSLVTGANRADAAVNALLSSAEAASLLLAPEHLEKEITKGYFGEPRVAAILTDILLEQFAADHAGKDLPANHPLRRIATVLVDPAARICVSGSTIGGTGAGVLPRLVDVLSQNSAPRAALCALISLEWFQLKDDMSGRVAKMGANSIACLWHYVRRMRSGYRLVVWGSPFVGQSRPEANFEDRWQAAKTDLTLPTSAIAAATAFLFADETAPEHVVPVAPADGVHLPRCLSYGLHDLNWLVERNRELMRRLKHIRKYLDEPYEGAVLPFPPSLREYCRVPSLDRLDTAASAEFGKRIDAILEAKERSIERLNNSDSLLHIAKPAAASGTRALREWLPIEASTAALTASLPKLASAPRDKSPLRLIKSAATSNSSFDPADVGTRDRLRAGHIGGLAPFDQVEARRIPDARGVELMLETFFANAHYQTSDVADAIVEDSSIIAPPSLARLDADKYPAWVHRWMFLLSALVSGAARPVRLQSSVLHVTHAIVLEGRGTRDAIGYLSPDLLCIPTMSHFWSKADELAGVAASLSSRTRIAAWLQTLRDVAECQDKERSLPPWFAYAETIAGSLGMRDLRAGDETVQFRFSPATQTLNIPLPAPLESTGRISLAEAVCTAFALNIRNLTAPDPSFTPRETTIWNELATRTQNIRVFQAAGDDWEDGNPAEIIWSDLLSDDVRSALNGDIFLFAGRGSAWRRSGGARMLAPHDVLTREIAYFVGDNGRKVFTHPVRTEYAALFRRGTAAEIENGRVSAMIELAGRPTSYEKRFESRDVQTFERLTVFSWPRLSSVGNGNHSILFASNTSWAFNFRVIYGTDVYDNLRASPTLSSKAHHTHYLEPAAKKVVRDARPRVLAVQASLHPESNDWHDIGLLPYASMPVSAVGPDETWAVDLGSSSTIVVRRESQANVEIVRPTEDRDATTVYSLGDGASRRALFWFPTWNEKGRYSSPYPTLPSQLVDLTGIRPSAPSEIRHRVFARDFAIDHGDDLDPGYMDALITDLKWLSGEKAEYRHHYLRHTLEQALSMEMVRTREFPKSIEMVFTLPLRQRSSVDSFVSDATAVTTHLQERTGLQIAPKFQWESLAVAPAEVEGDRMIVVADLGGGTLDLYAAYRRRPRRQGESDGHRTAAESAYIGGKRCLQLLRKLGALDPKSERVFLRTTHAPHVLTGIEQKYPAVLSYFDILYRYIVIWTSVLRQKWEVARDVRIDLKIVGLGWSLPGAARTQRGVADLLTHVAGSLAQNIEFVPYDDEEVMDVVDARKVFLARETARRGGYDRNTLIQRANTLEMVLGFDVLSGHANVSATADWRDMHPLDVPIEVTEQSLRRLYPGTTRPLTDSLKTRLTRFTDGRDPMSGVVSPAERVLITSPLTAYAELAVADLVEKA